MKKIKIITVFVFITVLGHAQEAFDMTNRRIIQLSGVSSSGVDTSTLNSYGYVKITGNNDITPTSVLLPNGDSATVTQAVTPTDTFQIFPNVYFILYGSDSLMLEWPLGTIKSRIDTLFY